MFTRARVRPGAEETPEDEEASLLEQRDLTLRSALDQIQQRRRTPRHSPPPPPRPLAAKEEEEGERRVPTPAAHPQGGGPLEALRQREWLLNLQEQQELQRLRAPTTPPHQEECPREKEEQLLFNGESPPSPPPTPAPPPREPPSSSPRSPARSLARGGGAGGWRRGARGGSIPTSRPPLRGRRGAPPHRFQRGWMPSYQHHRPEGMGSSSPSHRPVRGEGKEEEEDWQEKALPRSEQDEASMLARALELSRLDDARSRVEEAEEERVPEPRSGGGGRGARRRRGGGWHACPAAARPEGDLLSLGPPLGGGVVVGSIDAQQAPVVGSIDAQQAEGGVSFDQWLSLCSRYMPLLAQGLRELQRTAALRPPLLPPGPVPFPPPGWPHLPPPPLLPLAAPTAALIAELTGSALRANHYGQLPPPPPPLLAPHQEQACRSPHASCSAVAGRRSPSQSCAVASGGGGDAAPQGPASREPGHKSSSRQPSSHSTKRQPGSATAQPDSRGRRSQRGGGSSRRKQGPAARC